MADARAEEAMRKAEAKLKKQREQEIKDAEKDADEMAYLMANDPEVRRLPSSIIQIIFLTTAEVNRSQHWNGGEINRPAAFGGDEDLHRMQHRINVFVSRHHTKGCKNLLQYVRGL